MTEQVDVIVVGAGTAGSVLANRLTASGRLRVLLLEAGDAPRGLFVGMPAGFPRLFKTTQDWAFETEPQAAIHGRRIFTPRGRMLGGSSNMNAMMHQWCHPADFDGWVTAGASGWSWDEVREVFRNQETAPDPDSAERGHSGPMRTSANHHARPLTHDFVAAARAAGLGPMQAYNGHAYQGAFVAELAAFGGRRYSVYDAYLKPALGRPNLQVLTGAHALGLLMEQGRAVGVRYLRGGETHVRHAAAVVLAAGAYASPQLMMLSGIGAPSELKPFGLAVQHDLPGVGSGLQDHPTMPLVFASNSPDTMLHAGSPLNLLRYMLLRRGMLASNGVEGFAFANMLSRPDDAPDLELLFLPFEFRRDFLSPPSRHAFSMGPAVVAPRSRGTVRLRSAEPLEAPVIDPALLTDPEGHDAEVMWKGVALARRIANQAPLARWNAGELSPGAEMRSPEELRRYAGEVLQTVYHPTSTCRMGTDPGAVVDARLKVHGLDRLWIADASVMPSVPRGHPNAVVAMIAERAAGWVKADLQRGS